MDIEISNAAKLPKRRKKRPACPANVAAAMKDYAAKYKVVYKVSPMLVYDTAFGFVRINCGDGVGLKRLKQLTQQLRERARAQA